MCSKSLPLCLILLLASPPALACCPDFQESVIGRVDADLLAAPTGDFRTEITRIPSSLATHFSFVSPAKNSPDYWRSESPQEQTDRLSAADLSAALDKSPLSPHAKSDLLAAFTTYRQSLRTDPTKPAPLPAGLPQEFALYEQGAAAYHAENLPAAQAAWTTLLKLPPDQRPARTVWALYMLGRTLEKDPPKAILAFTACRTAVANHFSDSLGLAAASLGWEAKARWDSGDRPAAFALYFQQHIAGDPTAAWSLRDCAAQCLKADAPALARSAADPLTRHVITAYLVAAGGPFSHPKDLSQKGAHWLDALRTAHIQDLPHADRLAWVAYQAGQFTEAQRWLDVSAPSPDTSPVAHWIRAKLLLRAGKTQQAAASLAKAAAAFPPNEEWADATSSMRDDPMYKPAAHAAAELALLKLGRAQFTDALDLFYRNAFWPDAAYLAERILTPDELKTYIDKTVPTDSPLRTLLARRLTRLGRWKEARPYYPEKLQPRLDAYIAGIREGENPKRTPADRAASLMAAARIARHEGLELLGTELSPDYAIYGADYTFDAAEITSRLQDASNPAQHTLSPVTPEEQNRTRREKTVPNLRFHYRYTAANHAWAAAQLLPDDSPILAQYLTEAGNWLKNRDPKAADRFYKALVKRCPTTDLGRSASLLHWLPDLPSKSE